MNKKILIAAAAGVGLLLVAGSASADDELPPPPEPDPDDESDAIPPPSPEPKPPPSGKDPPNISGDPAGYNTEMFTGAMAVRQWFINMGYSVLLNQEPLINNASVKKFQRDYNKVAQREGNYDMGTLIVDGIAGKNTLNALEIAWKFAQEEQKSWNNIVKG